MVKTRPRALPPSADEPPPDWQLLPPSEAPAEPDIDWEPMGPSWHDSSWMLRKGLDVLEWQPQTTPAVPTDESDA